MKVRKNYLLLIAAIVWAVAGGNILRIGRSEEHTSELQSR